jgi:phosphohistidine phosphatase
VLWLLRHGDAADGRPDDERPLTGKGVQQSEAAGHALARLGIQIDACLTSPKLRAVQTARLACEPLGLEPSVDRRLAGEPFDPHDLSAGLGENVLLVGHDPSFSHTLHDLTGVQARMKKGGLAGIEKGELIVLLGARELRAIARAGERVG